MNVDTQISMLIWCRIHPAHSVMAVIVQRHLYVGCHCTGIVQALYRQVAVIAQALVCGLPRCVPFCDLSSCPLLLLLSLNSQISLVNLGAYGAKYVSPYISSSKHIGFKQTIQKIPNNSPK